MIHALKGVSQYAHRARLLGASNPELDAFVIAAIFGTLTNVNFDADRVADLVYQAAAFRSLARDLHTEAATKAGVAVEVLSGPAAFEPAADRVALLAQGQDQIIPPRSCAMAVNAESKELKNLEELAIYGLKGVAAYAYHAMMLGSALRHLMR